MKYPRLIVIGVIATVCLIAFFGWRGLTPDPFKDSPPLQLTKAEQNIYPLPCGPVALCIKFEHKIVNRELLAGRIYSLGSNKIVEAYTLDKGSILKILFDPGYTDPGKLLTELYPLLDDPRLFAH